MGEIQKQFENVTVIGLGNMGVTIARLLLDNGYKVTVWNRTASKAEPLIIRGATFSASVGDAISAAPVVIICVYDYAASKSILETPGATDVLNGKILIQVTTGSPAEARESEKWANRFGADCIDGAIQVAPDQMGKKDTVILFSGNNKAYNACASLLKLLAGNPVYLGEDAGAASAMDLATLSSLYGILLGFFHGAIISETEGFSVEKYASIVADILPGFSEFLKHEASVIQSGNFQTSQSPLSISVAATDRLVRTAKETGINIDFPVYAAAALRKAQQAGYENEELAAIVKTLRHPVQKEIA